MKEILTLCPYKDDQAKCPLDYAPSKMNPKICWRYREETGHCNHLEDPEKKGSFGQKILTKGVKN